MPQIYVPQKNMTIQAKLGENLMQCLLAAGLPVASSCLGEGICSMCKMTVVGTVSAPSELESRTLTRNKLVGQRLSCQILIQNDLTVSTSYW